MAPNSKVEQNSERQKTSSSKQDAENADLDK